MKLAPHMDLSENDTEMHVQANFQNGVLQVTGGTS